MNYTTSDSLISELKQLKEKLGLSNKQLAEKSGIPESTIARIFTGQTPNPTAITYISLKNAMTSCTDERPTAKMEQGETPKNTEVKEPNTPQPKLDFHRACNYECNSHVSQIREIYQNALKEKDKIIEDKTNQIKKLFYALIGTTGFLILLTIINLLILGLNFK